MNQPIIGKSYGNTIGDQSDYPVYVPIQGSIWRGNGATNFQSSTPWSVDGLFRNLYVEIMWPEENPAGGGWPDIDFELYVNDTPTGLKVTVPAHGASLPPPGYVSSAQDTVHTAAIVPGNTVALVRGAGTIPPGFNNFTAMIAWSMTFASTNPKESGYGMSSFSAGKLGATNLLLAPTLMDVGGLSLQSESLNAPLSHSIVPMNGNVTRLDVKLDTAPGTGATRTLALMLDGVVQDGSGGTVDTRVAISDSATSGFSTFTLPIVATHRLTTCQLVSGGTAPATSHVITSVCVQAAVDGQSALGFNTALANPSNDGTTDIAGGSDGAWANTTGRAPTPWSTSKPLRWPMSEFSMSLPGPIDPFALTNLCVNLSGTGPGTGKSYTFTTRRASLDTPAAVTLANSTVLDLGSLSSGLFSSPTDRLDITSVGAGTPAAVDVAWTWLVVAPSQTTTSKSHSGSFFQGQQGATFTVVVTNTSGVTSTGATVTETVPAGLTLVSMFGDGWTVVDNVASRNDTLAPGASYPPITVVVNVAEDATSPQCNQANEAIDCAVIGVRNPTPIVSTRRWAINRFDAKPKGGQEA